MGRVQKLLPLDQVSRYAREMASPGVGGDLCSGVISLFTDYSYQGPYLGQIKSRLLNKQPHNPPYVSAIIDLMHDAPAFNPRSAAYLLASCFPYLPNNSVVLAVVDPGVGTERAGLAVRVADKWLVGPDNGLLAPAANRFGGGEWYRLPKPQDDVSPTFHGRDVFADVAAELVVVSGLVEIEPDKSASCHDSATFFRGGKGYGAMVGQLAAISDNQVIGHDWPNDIDEVVYVDSFGNLHTGRRASTVNKGEELLFAGYRLEYAQKFADMPTSGLFWYENSMGMVEIAANCDSARQVIGFDEAVGASFTWARD